MGFAAVCFGDARTEIRQGSGFPLLLRLYCLVFHGSQIEGVHIVSNQSQGREKRACPRAPIELKVEYRRLNTFFADYTKNISRGGTFIKTHKPLDIGTDFIFKLFIPTLDEPLLLEGKVQWIVRPGEEEPGEQPGMGIKFEYIDEAKRRHIESIVEKLMIDSLGQHIYQKLLSRHSSPPE